MANLKKVRSIEGLSEDQLKMLARTGERYLQGSGLPGWLKSILKIVGYLVIAGSFVYMYFPADLIPDVIPVVGMADDSAFAGLGLTAAGLLAKAKQLAKFKGLAQMAIHALEKKDAEYQANEPEQSARSELFAVAPVKQSSRSFTVSVPRSGVTQVDTSVPVTSLRHSDPGPRPID